VFEEAARTGAPILRPLFYHYADDPATHELNDQFLLGRDLLLAPVLAPGQSCRAVYLPAGRWYDLRSGTQEHGGQYILADASLDLDPPIYARGGAIIPQGPVLQWTDQRPLDRLTLDIYPDKQGAAEGTLYEDDGQSLGYLRGEWRRTRYRCALDAPAKKQIISAETAGAFTPADRKIVIRLHSAAGVCERELATDPGDWQLAIEV